MNIYVGNLPYRTDEKALKMIFDNYGNVTKARIIIDRETNRSKGFGFVEMPNVEEAKHAVSELNQQELGGRKLVVNEARPRENRSNTPRQHRFDRNR